MRMNASMDLVSEFASLAVNGRGRNASLLAAE
jgi:hypothetical protein